MKKTLFLYLIMAFAYKLSIAQVEFNPYFFDNPGFSISGFVMEKGKIETWMEFEDDSAYLKPLHSKGFKLGYAKMLNFSDKFAISTGFNFGKFYHRFTETHLRINANSISNSDYYISEFPISLNRRFIFKSKNALSVDIGLKLIIIQESFLTSSYHTLITHDSARLDYFIEMEISEYLQSIFGFNTGIGYNYILPNHNYLNFRLGYTTQFPRREHIVLGEYEFFLNGFPVSVGKYMLNLGYFEFQVSYFFSRNKKWKIIT